MRAITSRIRKLGFTLMEVNLAILIMAGGVLAMVSLYPLGYRENQQSRDDVWAAAEADRIFNQLHATLSERAIEWSKWKNAVQSLKSSVGNWNKYCNTGEGWTPKRKDTINETAGVALSTLAGIAPAKADNLTFDNKRVYAIVVQPGRIRYNGETVEDWTRIAVSMRISRSAGTLFSQPIFFTEIHFQGDQEEK